MSTRRPRFKPAVILTSRKSVNESTLKTPKVEIVDNVLPDEPPIEDAPKWQNESPVKSETDPIKTSINSRRIIKPAVCIPLRKRKSVVLDTENTKSVDIKPVVDFINTVDQNANAENVPKDLVDHFKPPFMSPSVQNSQHCKRFEFVHNPLNSEDFRKDGIDDYSKNPPSPAKVRQRIRPTPCFGHRRNSLQGGNASESEEETTRRQRHLSTSSSHSNYNNYVNSNVPARLGNPNSGRFRTESVCSNASDAMSIRDLSSKPKRTARSEEFQRIANAKREFSMRFNGQTPDKARLTMYDMIYYNPVTNPMKCPASKTLDIKERRLSEMSNATNKSIKERRPSNASSVSLKSIKADSVVSSISSVKKEVETETLMPVPQLKLGPNGEIILDEKSLVIETTGDKEARETLANADIVYDDEFSGTSGFYKRNKRTREWPPEETIKFYRCLHTIGTDFSLMLTLFPARTRRDLKLKFKKEEKNNSELINKAILHPKTFNIEELLKEFAKEEEEMELKRKEWEAAKQRRHKDKRNYLSVAARNNISKSVRSISDGENIYEYEFVQPPRRKNGKKPKIVNNNENYIPISPIDPIAITTNSDVIRHEGTLSIPTTRTSDNIEAIQYPNPSVSSTIKSLPSFTELSSSTLQNKNSAPLDQDCNIKSLTTSRIATPASSTSNHDLYNNETIPQEFKLFSETCLNSFISKNPDLSFKLNSQDILNMDIIFDTVYNEGDPNASNILGNIANEEIVESTEVDYLPKNVISYEVCSQNDIFITDGSHGEVYPENVTNATSMDETNKVISSGSNSTQILQVTYKTEPTFKTQDNFETVVEYDRVDEIDSKYYSTNEEEVLYSADDASQCFDRDDIGDWNEGENEEESVHKFEVVDDKSDDYDNEMDSDDDDLDNFLKTLIVKARPDPNDPNKIIYEGFLKSADGDEPTKVLDLPEQIINRLQMNTGT